MKGGIHERFPKGQAWYNSVHPTGQLGYGKISECFDTFYSAASFSELDQKVQKGGGRVPKKQVPEMSVIPEGKGKVHT